MEIKWRDMAKFSRDVRLFRQRPSARGCSINRTRLPGCRYDQLSARCQSEAACVTWPGN